MKLTLDEALDAVRDVAQRVVDEPAYKERLAAATEESRASGIDEAAEKAAALLMETYDPNGKHPLPNAARARLRNVLDEALGIRAEQAAEHKQNAERTKAESDAKARARKEARTAGDEPLFDPKEYPLKALGKILGDAAIAISHKVRCAPEIAANSLLAYTSLAAQGRANVMMPFGQTRPASLFFMTVSPSGERKSTADAEAETPRIDREAELGREYAKQMSTYERKLYAWQSEREKIGRDRELDYDSRNAALERLGDKPSAPRLPMLTFDEGTQEGTIKAFKTMQPSLGLFSAEGGQFLAGHGMTEEKKIATAATFSQLWDGKDVRRVRAGEGVVEIRGGRLTINILVQENVAASFLTDPDLRTQGFLARFLVSQPAPLAGERPWIEVDELWVTKLGARYHAAVLMLFQAGKTKGPDGAELDLDTVGFSAEAKAEWIAYHDEVELGMKRPHGRYARMSDVASKSAEAPRHSRCPDVV